MSEDFEKARDLFLAGISAFESGRFSEAEKQFGLSLALLPERISTLNNLASTRISLGKPESALATLDSVLAREPGNLEALSHRGAALAALGRHEDALACYDRVLAADPERTKVMFHRATTLGLLERDAEAIAQFDRLLAIDPANAEAWLRRGQSLLRQGKEDDSLDSIRKALDLDPGRAEAWTVRGTILAEQRRNDEAALAFEQAIAHGGDPKLNGFFLAGMKGGAPAAPPRRYVETLFDDYAEGFEEHLVNVLRYQAHNILIDGLRAMTTRRFERALDLGCGTGLCGRLLQPFVDRMDGVDLSAKMLAKAKELGIYTELVHADVGDFLRDTGNAWDLVVAVDVFIYVGDLARVFAGVSRVADRGGSFCFSAEMLEGDEDFTLRPTLRYAQSERYIGRLASEHGFAIERIDRRPVREDRQQPIPGLYVYMTKR